MSLHVLCPSGVEFECKQNPGALKCGKSVPLMLNQKVADADHQASDQDGKALSAAGSGRQVAATGEESKGHLAVPALQGCQATAKTPKLLEVGGQGAVTGRELGFS
eukprot:1148645-Pelagomonas_calceolata.AAC.1